MRYVAITLVAVLLAACADTSSAICYKSVRAPGGKGPRALAAYACPSEQTTASLPLAPVGPARPLVDDGPRACHGCPYG
jgi:hypothetical protein